MTIRLGVIGFGSHAEQSHVQPGVQTGRFSFAAVYDPSEERMGHATKFNANVNLCWSAEELLLRDDVDAVVITSPDSTHPEYLRMAVNAGKHVLLDKPYASTIDGLQLLSESLADARARKDQRGRKLVVTGCQPRQCEDSEHPYGWVFANLPSLVAEYGQLVHVWLDFSYHVPNATWKLTRSLLDDHFVHELGALRWFVSALPGHNPDKLRVMRVPGALQAHNQYSVSGSIAGIGFTCTGTRMLEESEFPDTITLRFARGTVNVHSARGITFQQYHAGLDMSVAGIKPIDKAGHDHRFTRGMLDFADAIERGKPSYLSEHDLLLASTATISLLTAGVYASASDPS